MKKNYIHTSPLLDDTNKTQKYIPHATVYECRPFKHLFTRPVHHHNPEAARKQEEIVAPLPSSDEGEFGDKRDNSNRNKQ